jgi:putative tricarboxylic transport membrane protein
MDLDWSLVFQEWQLLPSVAFNILTSLPILLMIVIGTTVGFLTGMLPGLSAVMAMSLLVGFTFIVPPEQGLALLISVYVGAISSGGVTAILLNIPGTPAAAATIMDGFPLTKQGKAHEALGAAFSGSLIGEILGEFFTLLLLPLVAIVALMLGDWEIFLIALVGLTLAGALSGKNPLKGWITALLGVAIAMVGMEAIWGYPRFGYTTELVRGFGFVPALIGLFGLSEVLTVLRHKIPYKIEAQVGRVTFNIGLVKEKFGTIIRSTLIGVGTGIVPGIGESAAPWLAYDMARRRSKNKEEFGKGSLEGVLAAETANNATSGGALIPALVFGIPGSGPTAILIAALFMHNIRPGPLLMIEWPGLVAEIVVLFWLSAISTRVMAILLSPYFIKILSSPREILLPIAASLGVLGAWAAGFTRFDVYAMVAFGIVGYLFRQREFPLAPMVLGILVGGVLDTSLRRALITHSADFGAMFMRPAGLILLAVLVFAIVANLRSFAKDRKESLSEE